ncbi:hypothetical protein F511_45904 [Dorcoceras hygrometricum]|uniref:Uncharacterized protein n=1 Tax=Dorcoceras hygrometricum TaxID=472368 RepID=A0A2Z7A1X2_9LAMI|nr:hypothetical protein F511_45904 [Dorcoceras hygrometricum]
MKRDVEEKRRRRRGISAGCYLELAMAKRCRLHKLVRQRFDFAHIIQQDGSYNDEFSRMIFAKRFSRREDSAVARRKEAKCSSRCVISAAKQLTKGCQLLSSIQNGESDRSLQSKGRKYFYFTEERCTKVERRQDSLLER